MTLKNINPLTKNAIPGGEGSTALPTAFKLQLLTLPVSPFGPAHNLLSKSPVGANGLLGNREERTPKNEYRRKEHPTIFIFRALSKRM